MLNPAKGSIPIIGYVQCGRTKECGNDACFWRQRDVHGRSPFVHHLSVEEFTKKHTELEEEYGKVYFPEIYATTGTNVIYVVCPDFKGLEDVSRQ